MLSMLSCRSIVLIALLSCAIAYGPAGAAEIEIGRSTSRSFGDGRFNLFRLPSETPAGSVADVRPADHRAQLRIPTIRLAADEQPDALPPPIAEETDRFRLDTPPASAELVSPASLTLDDLEQIALQCNPTLAQAEMAVQAAEGRFVQAGLHPNPVIGYRAEDMGADGKFGQHGAWVIQEIVTKGKLGLGQAVAGHEIEQARFGWEAQRRRVLNDVRAGYYKVLLAQKTVEVNQRLVKIGAEGVEMSEKLRQALEVGRAEVLQAKIEADRARLRLNESQNGHRAAWRRLVDVVGQPAMVPQTLAGKVDEDLPEFTWEDTLEQLLTHSPELARAHVGVQRARCELARQCAERVPNFEVGVGVKYDDIARATVADVEVGIPLPLFNKNQGGIMQAEAGLVAAEREVHRVELNLRRRLAGAFEQYANARRDVLTYTENIIPNAKASLELVTEGFRLGEYDYLQLLTAQRTFFDVSLKSLQNLRELWVQSVEIEGLLLTGGLEKPASPR
jgi:cobalt-zinc-cadmium efflux system outer membrane protein